MSSTPTLWFGTKEKMQLVKAFASPLNASSQGFAQLNQFLNGGADIIGTFGRHRVFGIGTQGSASVLAKLEDYAYGVYGAGDIYFLLNSVKKMNVFPPNWAMPRLVEVQANGWPDIYDGTGAFSDTAANSTGQPARSITYTTIAAVPAKKFFIPIAPTETCYIGHTGSVTGSGVVAVRPVLGGRAAGGVLLNYGSITNLTPIAVTSTTRMNASFAGSTCNGIEVYLTGAGTVTVASLIAQIFPTVQSPVLTGLFQTGRGWSGMRFDGELDQITTVDNPAGLQIAQFSASLVERGQWSQS